MHLPLYLTLSSAMLASGSRPDVLRFARTAESASSRWLTADPFQTFGCHDPQLRPQHQPHRTNKASGSRGWYDSVEWKARSKTHLARNPL